MTDRSKVFDRANQLRRKMKVLSLRDMINEVKLQEIVSRAGV